MVARDGLREGRGAGDGQGWIEGQKGSWRCCGVSRDGLREGRGAGGAGGGPGQVWKTPDAQLGARRGRAAPSMGSVSVNRRQSR